MRTRLILVRHGQTSENTRGVMHADDDNTPLSEAGREQTKLTAKRLGELGVDKIYSSTEKRAEESAKIVSESLGLPYEVIESLKERRWGEFAGTAWENVEKILEPMSLRERYNYTPREGESWQDTETRLKNAIEKLLDGHQGETVAVITHAGAIRILMPFLLNTPIEETFKHLPDNASLTIFDYKGGKFQKVAVNDTSHLE